MKRVGIEGTSLTAAQLQSADDHIGAAIEILEGEIPRTYLMQLVNISLRLKHQGDRKSSEEHHVEFQREKIRKAAKRAMAYRGDGWHDYVASVLRMQGCGAKSITLLHPRCFDEVLHEFRDHN